MRTTAVGKSRTAQGLFSVPIYRPVIRHPLFMNRQNALKRAARTQATMHIEVHDLLRELQNPSDEIFPKTARPGWFRSGEERILRVVTLPGRNGFLQ